MSKGLIIFSWESDYIVIKHVNDYYEVINICQSYIQIIDITISGNDGSIIEQSISL